MATSAPRSIPQRQSRSHPAQPYPGPQPQATFAPPPAGSLYSDARGATGAPLQPMTSQPGPQQAYANPPQPQPGPYGTSPRSYGNVAAPGYGTTPPMQSYGITPSQSYGVSPHSQSSYVPPEPSQYQPTSYAAPPPPQQSRLHPADAYGSSFPSGGYTPPGRPRRGTAASDGGYAAHPARRQRRRSYDSWESDPRGYEYEDYQSRRASEEAAYDRQKRRERRARRKSIDKRPTVADSTIWAWDKMKGVFRGDRS